MLRYKGRVFCFGWVLVFVLVLVEDFGFGFWLGVLCVAVVLNGSRLRLFGSVLTGMVVVWGRKRDGSGGRVRKFVGVEVESN